MIFPDPVKINVTKTMADRDVIADTGDRWLQIVLEYFYNAPGERIEEKKALARLLLTSKKLSETYALYLHRLQMFAKYAASATTLLVDTFIRGDGDIDGVQAALATGAHINKPCCFVWRAGHLPEFENESTPLQLASYWGNTNIVATLLDAGAGVNLRNSKGRTALFIAAQLGHTEVVKMLLCKGADPNIRAFGGAPWLGSNALLSVIVSPGFDYGTKTKGVITDIFKVLVEAGADTSSACDDSANVLLPFAAREGLEEVIDILVSAGADVNECGKGIWRQQWTALYEASKNGHQQIVRKLLTLGARVNDAVHGGMTPLMAAFKGGYISLIKLLVNAGADVKAQNNEGETVLLLACEDENCFGTQGQGQTLQMIQLCLLAGAQVNVTDNRGFTPLHNAVHFCHADCVAILLARGADVSLKTEEGQTALHCIVGADLDRQIVIITQLLEAGADVNATDNEGYTPLGWAAHAGDKWLVRSLIKAGADVLHKNADGKTALESVLTKYDVASGKYDGVIACLRKAEALRMKE